MKKLFSLFILTFLLAACSTKKEGNMVVKGTIKGLKKGTLYLQKMKDTALVSVDSISVYGTGEYQLTDNVESPVIYYLTFDGNGSDKRILFFGSKGVIIINDNMETFGYNPEISGSENQLILDKFQKINTEFNNKSLEFIKKEFEAKKAKDDNLLKQLEQDYERLVRRKYLYATNFALTNSDSEVAPYIALTELYNANIKLLDTINNSLSPKIKNSDYGKKLDKFIRDINQKTK